MAVLDGAGSGGAGHGPRAYPTRGRRGGAACAILPAVNWVGLRNFLIIAAIAGLVLVWEKGFSALTVSANRIITVIFVAAMIAWGYNYFRQNRLAWLVLKPWMKILIGICGLGIAFLLVFGFSLFGDRIGSIGVVALIVALALVILWTIRESRRFR